MAQIDSQRRLDSILGLTGEGPLLPGPQALVHEDMSTSQRGQKSGGLGVALGAGSHDQIQLLIAEQLGYRAYPVYALRSERSIDIAVVKLCAKLRFRMINEVEHRSEE